MKMLASITVEVDINDETAQEAQEKAIIELIETCKEFIEGECVPFIEFEIREDSTTIDRLDIN